jgi:uncharacterized protein YacL
MTTLIRLLGAVLGTIVAFLLASAGGPGRGFFDGSTGQQALFVAWLAAWFLAGFLIVPYLTVIPAGWLLRKVQEMPPAEFVTAVGGLLVGLLMGLLLGLPLSNLPQPYGAILPIGVSIVMGLGMLGLSVGKRDDLSVLVTSIVGGRRTGAPANPAVPRPPGTTSGRIVVDTSALIDGRIADVAASGFLLGTLVVPRFVLGELQGIADSSDTMRRARGRRGLEILTALRKDGRNAVDVTAEDPAGAARPVDQRLVALARSLDAAIVTNDYNLNRVAEVEGVAVLNVNQLANALKPALLPGEELSVKVVQPGKEPGQGVGYLDDGTMIVVEGGARYLDHETAVTVTRVLQTVAGRMVFAQPRRS